MILPVDFYRRRTLDVARDLIGKVLVHKTEDGTTAGAIVEVEAYIGEDDPACHAAPGPTVRNEPLYGPPGRAYVYLNYGLHDMMNCVTEPEGDPAAVLIRALEPLQGLDLMRSRRAAAKWRNGKPLVADHELCRGPGNLCRAMGITLADNKRPLTRGALTIHDRGIDAGEIVWSPRIGIRVGTEHHWRAAVKGHKSVSGG
ncbi:MAG TPA: DNA-3-methyladenine glycosylase, partial [Vicinamibacterales bacterium]|nr:DNA-3-methyladenine glycosylase [Vicinamibacterales bacterium]